jgi:hypothetical protein
VDSAWTPLRDSVKEQTRLWRHPGWHSLGDHCPQGHHRALARVRDTVISRTVATK